jgi:hypothetical protein
MLDWLFGGKPQNTHSRKVYVSSSRRRGTQVFTVYGDTEVCAILAMKEVERQLPRPEPGETVEIKTYLG